MPRLFDILAVTLLRVRDGTLRRFLFIAAVGLWLGGFTFYGAFVIPVGTSVLGGHVRQGFVTQQVTDSLNSVGSVAICVIFWNAAAVWRARSGWVRFGLAATGALMALTQVQLLIMHPMLDRLLDPAARAIIDRHRFDALHRIYLIGASVQWAAGVAHVWCAVAERAAPDAGGEHRTRTILLAPAEPAAPVT